MDAHKHQGFRHFKHAKSKGFGHKYRGQATNTNKQLYWKKPGPTHNKHNQEGRRQRKWVHKNPSARQVIQDVGFRLVDCNNLSQHGKKIITSDPDV